MTEVLRLEVPAAEEGRRLDVFLASLRQIGSRSRGAALIEAGLVRVDGSARSKSFRLEAGQRIDVELAGEPEMVLQPEQLEVPVVYEDRWLLIADKPAGMVVHPSRGHPAGTLVNALLGRGIAGGESFRPGVVHRLDRDTSGLLLVAKDRAVHRQLGAMIRDREIDRRYLALVHGDIAAESGTIDAPIGRDPVRRKTMSVGGAAPRPAVTHFQVEQRLGRFTFVEVKLDTGRTHQIRVHFLAIGHPLVGDPVYARRDALGVGRQFLHSHRLAFAHPVTGDPIDASSPLPADLERILDGARASSVRGRSSP